MPSGREKDVLPIESAPGAPKRPEDVPRSVSVEMRLLCGTMRWYAREESLAVANERPSRLSLSSLFSHSMTECTESATDCAIAATRGPHLGC
jgi:hypothetical protein